MKSQLFIMTCLLRSFVLVASDSGNVTQRDMHVSSDLSSHDDDSFRDDFFMQSLSGERVSGQEADACCRDKCINFFTCFSMLCKPFRYCKDRCCYCGQVDGN